MRLIAFILVALIASVPAAAQSWREYAYPSDSFAVSFAPQYYFRFDFFLKGEGPIDVGILLLH